MNHSFFLTLAFACLINPCFAQAEEKAIDEVTVLITGVGAQHPGKYQLKNPATIEQALVLASGWNGEGELGIAPRSCRIVQHIDGKEVPTIIRVHFDRKTKQIQVLDEKWKTYHLAEGDEIWVPITVS